MTPLGVMRIRRSQPLLRPFDLIYVSVNKRNGGQHVSSPRRLHQNHPRTHFAPISYYNNSLNVFNPFETLNLQLAQIYLIYKLKPFIFTREIDKQRVKALIN